MYLFILESIGTQELILIGIIALIVFGPRKMPEMARKLGSMMSEFRKVSGEFKSTWENAVDLDSLEEPKKTEIEDSTSVADEFENSISQIDKQETNGKSVLPEVRNVSKEEFDELVAEKSVDKAPANSESTRSEKTIPKKSKKTDWL